MPVKVSDNTTTAKQDKRKSCTSCMGYAVNMNELDWHKLWYCSVSEVDYSCLEDISLYVYVQLLRKYQLLCVYVCFCGDFCTFQQRLYKLTMPRLTLTTSHYNDVIMSVMAYQMTSLTIVYSTIYSDADQRKHQSSTSLAFVREFTSDQWIPRTKGQ